MSIALPSVCLLGCPKPTPEPTQIVDDHPLRSLAEPLELQIGQTGVIENGVYVDSTKLFSVEIPDDWIVEEGNPFGERRMFMRHRVEEYHIEVWRVLERSIVLYLERIAYGLLSIEGCILIGLKIELSMWQPAIPPMIHTP